MHPFKLFNVEACHFTNATWEHTIRELDLMVVEPATAGKPANFECVKSQRMYTFGGVFVKRNRLNVPGPFYGAETDTCEAGPTEAPENVMLDSEGMEFVFRQPENTAEVKAVILAAASDPFNGYGADGNDHWNLPLIREWWRGRGEVAEWIAGELAEWEAFPDQKVAALHAFEGFMKVRAEAYLRAYAFYLEERHVPRSDDLLPQITT